MSTPPTSPSVPQEPPLGDQGTSIPLKASQDPGTTRRIGVSSDIPSPTTASAAPETMPNHGTSVAMAPSAPSSGHVPMPTPIPGGGGPMPSPSVGIPSLAKNQMAIPSSGNVLVNAAMTMPSPSLGAGGAMPPVLKFNGCGEFSGLLNHSPHSVVYEEELYPTALHLFKNFEARKFLDHRPDLADRIRQCERVEDITAISTEVAEFTRRDWGNVALSTVSRRLFSTPYFASRVWGANLC